jgi:hypothetical protein
MDRSSPVQRLSLPGEVLLCALLVLGCADPRGVGKTYPVAGKITFSGEPLTAETTMVLLKPDTSRGNTSPFEPAGTVDSEGNYRVFTMDKEGAPSGWYKVIVTATSTDVETPPGKRLHHPRPKSLLPAKYGQTKTTDLALEVVANPAPGAYDLKLTR